LIEIKRTDGCFNHVPNDNIEQINFYQLYLSPSPDRTASAKQVSSMTCAGNGRNVPTEPE